MLEFRKRIEEKKENLVADLAGCIRIPSVYAEDGSGYPYGKKVQECLEYMLETAARLGFSVHNMDNQLGWCEYGEGEEMIAVLCHLDVVPEGDGWTVPPYEGLVRDGRIYGRGTMDDKGPAMAALYGLLALKEAGVPLKRRIRLLFGLNEETGSADMKYYLKHGGEVPVMGVTPDGEYPVINGEKGLINEVFSGSFRQEGGVRLTEIRGGEAHNIVPAEARARLLCSPETAREIAEMKEDQIACELTEDGVSVTAAGVGAHGGAEAAEVLAHPLRVVPAAPTQIQAVPGGGRHAPHPGGEAVGEPRLPHLRADIKKDATALLSDNFHGVPSFSFQIWQIPGRDWPDDAIVLEIPPTGKSHKRRI